jgi:hypothetical protein
MSLKDSPILSVVIIPFAGSDYLRRCLTALTEQDKAPFFEIIVPYDELLRNISRLKETFSEVTFLRSNGRRTYAQLRALGVQKARGEIIALTEDHCIPAPDWCSQIVRAHGKPYAAIGGPVEKHRPDGVVNWALYLADYVRYMAPIAEGPSDHLTDCNVSYKQQALGIITSVWQKEFHEPLVHEALLANDESLWFSPNIIAHQQRTLSLLSAIKDRYSFGRLFGSGRVASASLVRRLLYAVFAVILPPVLVGRVGLHVFQKRRCVNQFFKALPVLTFLSTIWAIGESMGYLTGQPGASLKPDEKN